MKNYLHIGQKCVHFFVNTGFFQYFCKIMIKNYVSQHIILVTFAFSVVVILCGVCDENTFSDIIIN